MARLFSLLYVILEFQWVLLPGWANLRGKDTVFFSDCCALNMHWSSFIVWRAVDNLTRDDPLLQGSKQAPKFDCASYRLRSGHCAFVIIAYVFSSSFVFRSQSHLLIVFTVNLNLVEVKLSLLLRGFFTCLQPRNDYQWKVHRLLVHEEIR